MTKEKTALYENVKRRCAEKGISIQKLEKETGLSNGAIGKWKTSLPRVASIVAVAVYLGESIDNLVRAGGEE